MFWIIIESTLKKAIKSITEAIYRDMTKQIKKKKGIDLEKHRKRIWKKKKKREKLVLVCYNRNRKTRKGETKLKMTN